MKNTLERYFPFQVRIQKLHFAKIIFPKCMTFKLRFFNTCSIPRLWLFTWCKRNYIFLEQNISWIANRLLLVKCYDIEMAMLPGRCSIDAPHATNHQKTKKVVFFFWGGGGYWLLKSVWSSTNPKNLAVANPCQDNFLDPAVVAWS